MTAQKEALHSPYLSGPALLPQAPARTTRPAPPRHDLPRNGAATTVTTLDQQPSAAPVEPPRAHEPPEPDWQPPAPRNVVPNDQNAERYVLGAALLDHHQLTECGRLLTASDFWNPAHETVWRALTHLAATDQPTEPQAVIAHLIDTDHKAFQRAGGAPFIFSLIEACATPTNAPYFATRVEELARHRAAIAVFRQGLQRLEQPGVDVDDVLNTATTNLVDARDALTNPPASTSWAPVDLAAVLTGDYLDPPPTMLLRTDGVALFYDGAVHTVAGESESGKTWLTLVAALQLLQAEERVVFVDFEDRADRVVGRLMGLGATPTQIRDHFEYVRPDRPLDDDGRAQIAPHLHHARLVILDGVTEAMTMHGYDLNSNADSALFQGLLPRWIADHGPAVAMIDHVVKDKEKQGRFALGAQHKLAGIDGVAYLVTMLEPFARGKRGLARVDIGKDRPGHVREHAFGKTIAEFTLDASGDGNILIAHLMPPGEKSGRVGDTFEPTVLMEKISRYVQANPGMSKKAIEGVMNGKAVTIRLAMELLVTRGYIVTKSGHRGAIEHHHAKAYYADPERDPDQSEDTETDPWADKK